MKSYASCLVSACLALVSACASPENHAHHGDSGADDAPALSPEQISGTYLYVVSTILAPSVPTVYLAEIEAERVADSFKLRIRQRPLSKLDRVTPVADWEPWHEAMLDADGAVNGELMHAIVPAAANAIIGFDTELEIAMHGKLFDLAAGETPEGPVEFFCGDLSGRVLSPFPVDDLSGSTFTGSRIADVDDPSSYPPVVINCDHEPARPLP